VNTAPNVETLGRAGYQATAPALATWAGLAFRVGDALNSLLDGWPSGPVLVSGDADASIHAMDWTLEAQSQLLSRRQGGQLGRRG